MLVALSVQIDILPVVIKDLNLPVRRRTVACPLVVNKVVGASAYDEDGSITPVKNTPPNGSSVQLGNSTACRLVANNADGVL